ncbi:F510_1955 family glycosylhydrolase [Nonomuraea pusilla]|uniref:F510_1955 family glycosylhydrolase n=1 Tax=Nonomuraea pusilla TaxID=46177 RepID=UPI00332500EF
MRGTRVAAAAALTLALSSCTAASDRPEGSGPPDVGHVHGLGVDPADGALYVAGHYGLLKVTASGSAERVAGRVQDYMGFTVLGPRTFLASGHPGEHETGSPAHLGLIRSADAGVTWTTVSERGVADFHALRPAGTTLYAYDSGQGRVRASVDGGVSWRQGAQEEAVDLAAHADVPERVYATTAEGVRVSENGGMEFEPFDAAPPLTQIEAPAPSVLIGTDTTGRVRVSTDAGKTWRTRGTLAGGVTAFTAVDDRRLLAATEDGAVHESKDGGSTFSVVFRPARA